MKELFVDFIFANEIKQVRVIEDLQVIHGFWVDEDYDYVTNQQRGLYFIMPHMITLIESKTVYTQEEIDEMNSKRKTP